MIKYIKVKSNSPVCTDEDGNFCMYFNESCTSLGLFPACNYEEIIYLKVKNDS